MIRSLKFNWFTKDQIVKLAEVKINIFVSLDKFGHPVPDGFYDLRMGPCEKDHLCLTCGLNYLSCPGHFGYVEIEKSINPLSFDVVTSLYKSTCFDCKRLKLSEDERLSFLFELKKNLISTKISKIERVEELERIFNVSDHKKPSEDYHIKTVHEFIKKSSTKSRCPLCNRKSNKIKKDKNKIVDETDEYKVIKTMEIYEILVEMFKVEKDLIEMIFNADDQFIDQLFVDAILVTPNKFRPIKMRDEMLFENAENTQLIHLMNMNVLSATNERYKQEVQTQLNLYVEYIKTSLEKKQGLFRQNIMGKRVNYSARSVISPDPSLGTGEIGVPLIFAQQLTFPEKMTDLNRDRLMKYIKNGSDKYPGANLVEIDGKKISLKHASPYKIKSIMRNREMIVHRHLIDGDRLLVNRQPTLHVVSLMGHRAKVLRNEKTLRMHYVNCKPYNADFDGDEMNIHFPQSYKAMAEIEEICKTDRLYFAPSTNIPIRGLTQDHIVAASVLSSLNTYFTVDEYRQIVYMSLYGDVEQIQFIEPSIMSDQIDDHSILYTGSDVITTILINMRYEINYTNRSKITNELVIVAGSVFITGYLDKNTLGTTKNSLVDELGAKYGYGECNKILTVFGRMVNAYLLYRGFTLRYDDLLLDDVAENEIERTLKQTNISKDDTQTNISKILKDVNENVSDLQRLLNKHTYKSTLNNNMLNIIKSGAKGSLVNLSQISICLGQQELEGKRVPVQSSGKSLPCYKPSDYYENVSAGGFVLERFLYGLKPSSFYFHCMAGREGLIDTAVKTANSGYLQRCLVKHMEGVIVAYDKTVRRNNKIISYKSADEPGTSVGVIAGQSIGEPSTQMTLNTFHLAGVGGRNVTLGIPRLREIVMVAAKEIKTPSININRLECDYAQEVAAEFKMYKAHDLIERIKIDEKYVKEGAAYYKRIDVEMYVSEMTEELEQLMMDKMSEIFLSRLNKKLKVKLTDVHIFSGEEIKQENVTAESDTESTVDSDVTDDMDKIDETDVEESKPTDRNESVKKVDQSTGKSNVNFKMDDKTNKLKMISVSLRYLPTFKANVMVAVESVLRKLIIKHIDGFTGAKAIDQDGLSNLFLDGSNFTNLYNLSIIHNNPQIFYSTYSNDIHSVLVHFGVEAARNVLVSEIENVFDVYGIKIESKHLELVGDYLMRNGEYSAFNRHYFDADDSIIQRMSFESCYKYMVEAGKFRCKDEVRGPSSNIAVGNQIKNGTGSFDILYDMSMNK